jgi:hypothetical protein
VSSPNVPELPKFSYPITERDVLALNDFTIKLRRLLLGGLTQANAKEQTLDVAIRWPNMGVPAVLTRPRLTQRPSAVTLVSCRLGEITSEPASIADTLAWDWSDGSILLPQFYEPTASAYWSLRLHVTEAV